MTTSKMSTPPVDPDSLQSRTEHLEEEAELAGIAAAGGLRAVEVAGIVLLGLLVCPPLAILTFLVVAPLLVLALVLGLLTAIISTPYLLVHAFRGDHRGHHLALLKERLRRAGHALFDLAPHRIVADVRKLAPRR